MENLITVQNAAAVPQTVKPDYMQRFIDYLDASESTIRTYTTALKQFACWMAENGIVSPVREDILAYKTWLKETPYEKNGKLCQSCFSSWASGCQVLPDCLFCFWNQVDKLCCFFRSWIRAL